MSRTYLRKCMTFKVIKRLNPIGAMKIFTKPNCNLCMQEPIKILKKLRDKRVTVMHKNSEIYVAFRYKTTFHRFFRSPDDTVFNGWKGSAIKGIFKSYDLKPSTFALNTENNKIFSIQRVTVMHKNSEIYVASMYNIVTCYVRYYT